MEDPNAPKPCAICGDIHPDEIFPAGSKWDVVEMSVNRWGLIPPGEIWPINIQPTYEMAQHYFPIVVKRQEESKSEEKQVKTQP